MTEYFTADTHFLHKNILKYSPKFRPFHDVSEMTEALVEYWNSTVKEEDTVYHLGDFGIGSKRKLIDIRGRLNGNIIMIRGNHDYIHTDHDILYLNRNGQQYVLCHYPMSVWKNHGHGSIMLHGHCHGSYQGEGKIMDVGWDAHGKFLTFKDINSLMEQREIHCIDHHRSALHVGNS